MKKKLILLLVLCLVMTSLVGCKKDDSKEAEAPATETETETKTETASEEKPEEKASEAKEAEVISGTMTEEFDLSNHEAKESVRLWIPVAQSDEYQDISNMKVMVNGEDSGYEINEDDLGNKMIYV